MGAGQFALMVAPDEDGGPHLGVGLAGVRGHGGLPAGPILNWVGVPAWG